eukprot:7378325-Prymnesium_polylepis.1
MLRHTFDHLLAADLRLLVVHRRKVARLVLKLELIERRLDLLARRLRLDPRLAPDEREHRVVHGARHLGAERDARLEVELLGGRQPRALQRRRHQLLLRLDEVAHLRHVRRLAAATHLRE